MSNESQIIPENPRTMVFQVLESNKTLFLSVREIVTELFNEYNYHITVDTVYDTIKQLQAINQNIISRIERRGEKRQPVYVYSLIN